MRTVECGQKVKARGDSETVDSVVTIAVVTSVSRLARQAGAIVLLVCLAGCAGLRRSMVTGYDHVRVYFATTREYDPSAKPDRAFTKTGTKKEWIFYGTAEVGVP